MSKFRRGARQPSRPLPELPVSRVSVPRSVEPRTQAALERGLTKRVGTAYVDPNAPSGDTKFLISATGLSVTGGGTTRINTTSTGYARMGVPQTAAVPGAFAANLYVEFADENGVHYFVPAMTLSW